MGPTPVACPLCNPWSPLDRHGPVAVLADAFPVAEGHVLVVPTRHVDRLGALTTEERHALIDAAAAWTASHPAEGWTFGLNDGAAAGQTIDHVHLHLIPRRTGDVPDPRGGVRWVIPARAGCWQGE